MTIEEQVYRTDWGREFRFNDHVCVEMTIGVPDEKRIGRLIQVRKGVGAFGSDLIFIRLRDGELASFENAMIRGAFDKRFEDAFYRMNGKEPPVIPPQEPSEDDSPTQEYTIQGKWPETGFIIERPSQPNSNVQSFAMMVTHAVKQTGEVVL